MPDIVSTHSDSGMQKDEDVASEDLLLQRHAQIAEQLRTLAAEQRELISEARSMVLTGKLVSEYDAGRTVDALQAPPRREITFPAVVTSITYGEPVPRAKRPCLVMLRKLGAGEIEVLGVYVADLPYGIKATLGVMGDMTLMPTRTRPCFFVPELHEVIAGDECQWVLIPHHAALLTLFPAPPLWAVEFFSEAHA